MQFLVSSGPTNDMRIMSLNHVLIDLQSRWFIDDFTTVGQKSLHLSEKKISYVEKYPIKNIP